MEGTSDFKFRSHLAYTVMCCTWYGFGGGIGQGYSYLLLNWYKIYLFSEGFNRMPFWTDQKF